MKTLSDISLKKLLTLIKTNFFRKSEAQEVSAVSVDDIPTQGSTNLVSSGGVYTLFENAKAKAQTVTIAVADWSGGTTVTKSVTGVTATSIVIVDTSDGNVECTGQESGTLTFTATGTPTAPVVVKVVIL